jgi:MFS transporter, ACS family, pantothenate transporter
MSPPRTPPSYNTMDSDVKSATVVYDRDNSGNNSIDEESAIISKSPKKTWRSYVWDTFDKSPEERRFLFKLDAVVLSLASLGYFIKYLDQVNINSAFVSGMKEDLGLYGNQLNYITTAWTVGYVIGEIPR